MIDCDPALYVFMVRYPEVVVNMWELMDITRMKLKRIGKYTFDANDGAGTSAKVQLVYGTSNLHVYYGEGFYEGPLLKRRTKGRCVLVLASGYTELDNGRTYVTSRLDVFVRVDSIGAELVAKTLQPLIGKTADFNYSETHRFLSEISRAAETKWPGMERLLPRLKSIEPWVRDNFEVVASRVKAHDPESDESVREVTVRNQSASGDRTTSRSRTVAVPRSDPSIQRHISD